MLLLLIRFVTTLKVSLTCKWGKKNISTWFWTSDRPRWSGLWDLCAICIDTPTLIVLYTTLYVKILSRRTATRQILARARWRGKEISLLLLTRCERLFCKVRCRILILKMVRVFQRWGGLRLSSRIQPSNRCFCNYWRVWFSPTTP